MFEQARVDLTCTREIVALRAQIDCRETRIVASHFGLKFKADVFDVARVDLTCTREIVAFHTQIDCWVD